MFTVKEIDNKFYILNDDEFVADWDGQPLRYGKSALAEKVCNKMNEPVVVKPNHNPLKVTGVMDNRHRNWRRRNR